jgi:hypothetical protein
VVARLVAEIGGRKQSRSIHQLRIVLRRADTLSFVSPHGASTSAPLTHTSNATCQDPRTAMTVVSPWLRRGSTDPDGQRLVHDLVELVLGLCHATGQGADPLNKRKVTCSHVGSGDERRVRLASTLQTSTCLSVLGPLSSVHRFFFGRARSFWSRLTSPKRSFKLCLSVVGCVERLKGLGA